MASAYHDTYAAWRNDPLGFWRKAAAQIDWVRPPRQIFDADAGVYGHWFPDAQCNTCYNALDRHIATRGDQPAIIYDSPIAGAKQTWTYRETLDEVATLAAVLLELGVGKGDRVLLYMPMIPQAMFGMLACARIGAVHSVVFGGFAAKELATRIDDARPKLILAASCGIEPGRVVAYKPLLDQAIDMSRTGVAKVLLFQRPQLLAASLAGRDHDWAERIETARRANRRAGCVTLNATDPLYVLYTSGTTGVPKGVVRDNGGYMVALQWSMTNLYNIAPGEVFWTASDVGWVVGHSYIVYGPLLQGATTILFEGKPVGTPDAGVFWRVIAEHNVVALFTAPTAFRAIRKEDPEAILLKQHAMKKLRTLFLAGERADPDTVQWAERVLNVPVIDHWWQTETGWCIAGNPVGLGKLPVKYGSATVPMPGYEVCILDEAANPLPGGTMGAISIRLPLPPGALTTLWQNDDHMRASYLADYPGYYKTADAGYIDADGYLFVMGRTDDIINVAGHRLSTGGMEEVLASHPDVAECAVIGAADALKGETPVGFLVLKSGVSRAAADIEADVVKLVRERIGPVASFRTALTVARLPKTRSGKILRGTMKKIADKAEWSMPATVDDPAIFAEIAAALERRGF